MFATALATALGLLAFAPAAGAQSSIAPPRDTAGPALAVVEVRGHAPGPTVALVAGVHGGKRAAVRAVETLVTRLRPDHLRGTVLLVPRANAAAVGSGLAQLSPLDSLNLNRVFPGRPDGRPTERLAHRILTEIVARSDYLVDLHGPDGEEAVGAFAYAARPGVDPRVDSAAFRLAEAWGTPRVVWDAEGPRTVASSRFLQTAAHLSGVPAITVFEAGRSGDDPEVASRFTDGALRLLARLGMISLNDHPGVRREPQRFVSHGPDAGIGFSPQAVHSRRAVVAAPHDGTWRPLVRPDRQVSPGELLGTLTGSSGVRLEVRATAPGVVLHQRLPAQVAAQAPLIILAVDP